MQDTGQGAGRIARTGGATKEAVAASRARQGSFVAALGFQAQRLLDRILLDAGIAASSPETSSGATAPQRRPDGRPLYLYPVADEVFALLGESSRRALEACQDRGGRVPDWLCQLVVFYGAHWFRRRGEGRIQRWDDLGILPEGFDPVPRSELVRRGLGLWGLSVVKTSQRREWLHTLALNGASRRGCSPARAEPGVGPTASLTPVRATPGWARWALPRRRPRDAASLSKHIPHFFPADTATSRYLTKPRGCSRRSHAGGGFGPTVSDLRMPRPGWT